MTFFRDDPETLWDARDLKAEERDHEQTHRDDQAFYEGNEFLPGEEYAL